MARQRFLVTGGAGYIGSHLVLALCDRGDEVVVLDDLRQGHRAAVPAGVRLIVASVLDSAALDAVLADGPWDAVFHFAAVSLVGESMQKPFYYFWENGAGGIRLVEACVRHGIKRFVLSSTANVYGNPERVPIEEDARIDPHSPYGESKLMIERTLRWANEVHGLRSAVLRYFNAAGSDLAGRAGEDHDPETHLIPLIIDAALGRRPEIAVFGTDYPTRDGTCIRDYIHVGDLAQAHLDVLAPLEHRSALYNLGNGLGHSVMDIISSVRRVSGRAVPTKNVGRRAGDPATLVASSARLRHDVGWEPRMPDIDDIVRTAFTWREQHPRGYDDR